MSLDKGRQHRYRRAWTADKTNTGQPPNERFLTTCCHLAPAGQGYTKAKRPKDQGTKVGRDLRQRDRRRDEADEETGPTDSDPRPYPIHPSG